MKIFKTLLTLLILACGQSTVRASVNQITYKIVFNPATCLYDVFMTIQSGSTTSVQEQEAYTAQVSLVVPTGTTVGTSGIVSNEPRIGSYSSGTLSRTAPTAWTNSNAEVNNAALTGYDVYSFVPSVSEAYYGALKTNDVVLLFSIPISTTSCGSGIRLWKNNTIQGAPVSGGDPSSASFGGLDFNNGHNFTSSTELFQAYTGNGVSATGRPRPTLKLSPDHNPWKSYTMATTAAAGASSCATGITYSWTGPNSFSSTASGFSFSPVKSTDYGTYTLTVGDGYGCTTEMSAMLSSPGALPVTLVRFGADADKCMAALSWETAQETNFDRFDVQYSGDGSRFETIGQVAGKKNPSGSSYAFSHNQEHAKGYYRLKMADHDGTFTFSQTAAVTVACDRGAITVLPNPSSGAIRVTGLIPGNTVSVTALTGQVVRTTVSTGESVSLDLSAYPAGMYQVVVMQDQKVVKTTRIVRQ